jgi:putative transposase
MMIVAHKIQLLPNNRQALYFRKACGVARFAWNWGQRLWDAQNRARFPRITDDYGVLVGYEKRTVIDDTGNSVPHYNAQSLKKEFSALIDAEWPWMRETTSYAYQRVFSELENAHKRFLKGLGGRFRAKKRGQSRDSFYLANTCVKVDGRHVTIQKLGPVRMRLDLRFQGKIMSARVSRDADKWFVSISVEMPDTQPVHKTPTGAVGVDMGVKVMAALSTGEMRENPRSLSKHEKKLKKLQRKLSRQMEQAKIKAGIPKDKAIPRGTKIEVSNRMLETKRRIQRAHQDISGVRSNAQHQLSAELTKRFGVIAVEDLNVKGMTASANGTIEKPGKQVAQKAGLNRSILDVGFGELRRQLDYKSKRTGAQFVVIGRWTPSSKACSACGHHVKDMNLSVREWTCPECGAHHDRDINAAQNIKTIGLQMLADGIQVKEKNATGKLNPRRKVKISVEETTVDATGYARGESSLEDRSVNREPGRDIPVRPGAVAIQQLTLLRVEATA